MKFIFKNFKNKKQEEKSSSVAFLLCAFFGFLGLHRFYTGYYLIGLFQMLTCGGFIVWFLIDIISLFRNEFDDSRGIPLVNHNSRLASGLIVLAVIFTFGWSVFYVNKLIKLKTKIVSLKNNNQKEQQNNRNEQKNYENYKFTFIDKSGINVIKDNPCQNLKKDLMICGSVVNTTDSPAKNIVVKIELFDKDKNFINFAYGKIYYLNPKSSAEFQAPIYYDTAVNYKIIKISSN